MSRFRSSRQSSQLPDGFTSIQAILDGNHNPGTIHNIIGVVTDFRAPVSTRGTDWKCQFRLYDRSVDDPTQDSLAFNVFRIQKEMPDAGLGDVMVIFQAKIQSHQGCLSLITHKTTDIHLYSANLIPKPPHNASKALKSPLRRPARQPKQPEHEYVSILYHAIDKDGLPTEAEFTDKKLRSSLVADKFRELKRLQDGIFADIIVRLVKSPYDLGDKVTLWVSDYSENANFFHFMFKGLNDIQSQVPDLSGLLDNFPQTEESAGGWPGPFGKRSMQVTCYEPHASFIRESKVDMGAWMMLRNVQVKFGHNATNLEGYLRGDRNSKEIKINISILDLSDTDSPDPRLKEAVRRKRDYEREQKEQLKEISDAAMAGKKRKSILAEGSTAVSGKKNSRARRNKKRATEREVEKEVVVDKIVMANLNTQVKCEFENKATSTVEDILRTIDYNTYIDGQEVKLPLPFVNVNYRAQVRIVNFMPSNLANFACPKRVATTEYDMLSDNEESDADSESEQDTTLLSKVRDWEWRFYLELEDATPIEGNNKKKKKRDTFWVSVDNFSAQCLMDLDASNLREKKEDLETLRRKLFLLWGDLEEKKSLEMREKERAALSVRSGGPPPPHSSDDEGSAQNQSLKVVQINNRPFACCIRQYGVKVPESDPSCADAGSGKRWQRMFGLFGTRIA